VPLAEALDELARDRERLAVLGRAGRMRAEQHFSDAVLAARTRAFHATMMRERA
jgi:starch synthase